MNKPVEQGASMEPELRADRDRHAVNAVELMRQRDELQAKLDKSESRRAFAFLQAALADAELPEDFMPDSDPAERLGHFVEQYEALKVEVKKLSARIDEIQLAETKAVEELARVRGINEELVGAHNSIVIQRSRLTEELARVRDLLKEYRNFSWHSSCNEHSLEGDRRCLTCLKTDAFLAPKPLDANEGGE